uniref:Uncharacterized protein n=1 Tax=Caenorhabditis tropicalis TaxID=1561998 RepID=A0A1I7UPN6_9PELO
MLGTATGTTNRSVTRMVWSEQPGWSDEWIQLSTRKASQATMTPTGTISATGKLTGMSSRTKKLSKNCIFEKTMTDSPTSNLLGITTDWIVSRLGRGQRPNGQKETVRAGLLIFHDECLKRELNPANA